MITYNHELCKNSKILLIQHQQDKAGARILDIPDYVLTGSFYYCSCTWAALLIRGVTGYLLITVNKSNFIILHSYVATCFSHYVVILRLFKYIKTEITIATRVMGSDWCYKMQSIGI
jgi:ABC-type uncharacterized transport system permease subunit